MLGQIIMPNKEKNTMAMALSSPSSNTSKTYLSPPNFSKPLPPEKSALHPNPFINFGKQAKNLNSALVNELETLATVKSHFDLKKYGNESFFQSQNHNDASLGIEESERALAHIHRYTATQKQVSKLRNEWKNEQKLEDMFQHSKFTGGRKAGRISGYLYSSPISGSCTSAKIEKKDLNLTYLQQKSKVIKPLDILPTKTSEILSQIQSSVMVVSKYLGTSGICKGCSIPIPKNQPSLSAMGFFWHQECFKCANTECGNPIGQSSFFQRGKYSYCESCWKGNCCPKCESCGMAVEDSDFIPIKEAITATHFTSETEIAAYVNWINSQLSADPELEQYLPISLENQDALFEACKDGILLCKLINNSVSGVVNEKGLVTRDNARNQIHKLENIQKALDGAVKIGVHVHNMSAEDIVKGTPHLVLGLVWQVIKVGLLKNVRTGGFESTSNSANDLASKASDPTPSSLEKGLLKWVNSTLKKQNPAETLKISNFGSDLSDSIALAYLISSFDNDPETRAHKLRAILDEEDINHRAELVLDYAEAFDCRHFASPTDIVGGNKNLNLAFVAVLHNLKVSRDKTTLIRIELEDAKDSAEAALANFRANKDTDIKRLRLQLDDANEDFARLQAEKDAVQAAFDELNKQKREEKLDNEKNENFKNVAESFCSSQQALLQVSIYFESVVNSLSKIYHVKESLKLKHQEQLTQIQELNYDLSRANQKIKELQDSNAMLRQWLLDSHRDAERDASSQSLNDISNSSVPANSVNNLAATSFEDFASLSQQLKESQQFAQILQYKLLALQTESAGKVQELQLKFERGVSNLSQQQSEQVENNQKNPQDLLKEQQQPQEETKEKQQQNSQEKKLKQSQNGKRIDDLLQSATFSNTDLQKNELKQIQKSIDTLCSLQLLLTENNHQQLLQESIANMQELSVNLFYERSNETQILERVFEDLKSDQEAGYIFNKINIDIKTSGDGTREFAQALASVVGGLNRKVIDSEQKAAQLAKSVDTLNFELERVQHEKTDKEASSGAFRDASIDTAQEQNDAKIAKKIEYIELKYEKESLNDRLAILHKTTAAIIKQRSLLIEENKKIQQSNGESINISRQIESLDNLLAGNAKLAHNIETGHDLDDIFGVNANTANLEQLALQQARVQHQIDQMVKSEDCLIDDLTKLKDSNQELREKLEIAERCINALIAQRSVLLKERDELSELAKSQANESLSQTESIRITAYGQIICGYFNQQARSMTAEPPDLNISCQTIDNFKEKLWTYALTYIQSAAIINGSNYSISDSQPLTSTSLQNLAASSEPINVSVYKYSLTVKSQAQWDKFEEQVLKPRQQDQSGAAANSVVEEIMINFFNYKKTDSLEMGQTGEFGHHLLQLNVAQIIKV
ncbi:hypothetical protein HK100_007093 [Physocladia obscura]|uniref:Uncharacterized protein n=1 Tax=Physocladia obscura TaxID=109957 RepID=A0AAD5XIT4_9FUNG|nr:hypothetical protein HK100_007093 [Physocladia obscura]